MRKLKNRVLTHAKHVTHSLKYRGIPRRYLYEDIPYFSQWESRALNRDILNRKIDATDDPLWRNSGAKTKDEYRSWSWASCGMACTKMILAHRTGKILPTATLGMTCASYGGYEFPLEDNVGLIYTPYVTFLKKEFGLSSKIVSPLLPREIMHELSEGHYVIASVGPNIRNLKSWPKQKGGHLILMLGYDLDKQEFYFHNPSGDSVETQECAAVSFADFAEYFGGRGIVIY